MIFIIKMVTELNLRFYICNKHVFAGFNVTRDVIIKLFNTWQHNTCMLWHHVSYLHPISQSLILFMVIVPNTK